MEKEIRITVHINAAPEAVWDTLTNPAKIAQYMYGAVARTRLAAGQPRALLLRPKRTGNPRGQGRSHLNQAPRYLEHTLFPTTGIYPTFPKTTFPPCTNSPPRVTAPTLQSFNATSPG
jgi:hypothetical protein